MKKLSAVVITLNESANIKDCLEGLSFCDELVVVDSGSKDQTVEIAKAAGARVLQRNFDNFAFQKNFAVSQAEGTWILSIDADERVSKELSQEILGVIHKAQTLSAYAIPRHNLIFGKRLRQGISQADAPTRLFKKDGAQFEGIVHETVTVKGEKGRLNHPIVHHSTKSIKDYMRKLNHYSELERQILLSKKTKISASDLLLQTLLRFLKQGIFKLGLFEGVEGFMFSILSGYYDFIRFAKAWERENGPRR